MNMPFSKVFDPITWHFRYHDFCKIETTLLYVPLFWVFMIFSTIHIWCGFHFMSAIFFYFVCFLFWNKIMYLFIKLNVQFQINTKVLCIPWLFQDFCWAFHIWMDLILKMDCYDITIYISILHLEMLVLNTAKSCNVIWFGIIIFFV